MSKQNKQQPPAAPATSKTIQDALAHRERVRSAWTGAMAATDDPRQFACLHDSMVHELERAGDMIAAAGGTP